jgi:phosphatidylinositol alpha-mannosyltransferase
MTSLRIGLVCPYAWDVPGGVAAHIRDLVHCLRTEGHDVSVLTPAEDPASLPDYCVDGGRPVAVRYNGSVARVTLGVSAAARVRRWIRDGDFDVLHVHEPMNPSLSVLACWVAQGPIVATWHSSIARSRALSASYYLAQISMEKVTARIAVSEDARRTLVAHLGGDAVLIPNGVDVAAFTGSEALPGWPGDGGSVLFLGRIDEERKGWSVLARALPDIIERYPAVRVLVAGPGDHERARAEVRADLHDRITFLGRVSDEVKAQALHSVDVYVAPHTGGESFGIVLLEAMASGTPVLASDIAAFRRVLDGGRCGRLFAADDPAALARGLIELLADPGARASLAVAGRRRAEEFDWQRVGRDVVSVYESVVTPGERVRVDIRAQLVGRLASAVSRSSDGG